MARRQSVKSNCKQIERAIEREVGLDVDAKRHRRIRRAGLRGQRTIAVLGDRHARASQPRGSGGDVQRPRVCATGADDIHRSGRRLDAADLGAHDLRRGRDLVDRLAAQAQRHQEARDLLRGGRRPS